MSLSEWAKAGWIRPYKPTKSETSGLLEIVQRDIKAARETTDPDWRFMIA